MFKWLTKFFKKSFADMKENTKAQHTLDVMAFEEQKRKSRERFEQNSKPAVYKLKKLQEESNNNEK